MKNRQDILSTLAAYQPVAIKNYGLKPLGIFGSVARGEQTEDSDIDIFYEGRVPSLLTLDSFIQDMEKLLGQQVDVVRMRPNMNPLLLKQIQKEGIYVQ